MTKQLLQVEESLIVEERLTDSPYVESVTRGWTVGAGQVIRPAEIHWHMVFARHPGGVRSVVVGPWRSSGRASWGAGAEILWVKFRLGVYMPHLPTKDYVDGEQDLPGASSDRFWWRGATRQVPDFENIESFIDRLIREGDLVQDPLVTSALQEETLDRSARTLRHRFLYATGQSQSHIRQYERAIQAASLLRHGVSILDAVHEAGYFDQPHMTRALKQFIGYTPAQISREPHR